MWQERKKARENARGVGGADGYKKSRVDCDERGKQLVENSFFVTRQDKTRQAKNKTKQEQDKTRTRTRQDKTRQNRRGMTMTDSR